MGDLLPEVVRPFLVVKPLLFSPLSRPRPLSRGSAGDFDLRSASFFTNCLFRASLRARRAGFFPVFRASFFPL